MNIQFKNWVKDMSSWFIKQKKESGNSLVVQWLGLQALTARGMGSIPGQRTKIPHATWPKKKKKKILDFPDGAVVKNLPANAGDMGSILGPRKIPHATEQLSPCATAPEPVLQSPRATTTEPVCRNYWSPWPRARVLQQERPPQWEAHALRWRVAPARCN